MSKGLFDLCGYKQLAISPVVFSAAVTAARKPIHNMDLRQIVGCPELVKYELKVTAEADAREAIFS